MKAVAVLCVCLVLGVVGDQGLEARCKQIVVDFTTCTRKAHTDYSKAMAAGDDGRPDFVARKSCNYLTEAVEGCGSKLIGECNTADKVQQLKDKQIVSIVGRLKTSIQAWESDKCPAVKAHFDRLKAAAEPEPEAAPEDEPEAQAQAPAGGASALAFSGLLLGGLLLV